MSAQPSERFVTAQPVGPSLEARGGLAHALLSVRHRTGFAVLLDTGDGEVVDHAVGNAPPIAVVRAVLTKDTSSLIAAGCRPRTVAVIPSGPVIRWQINADLQAAVVPVTSGAAARLWLIGDEVILDERLAHECAEIVAARWPVSQGPTDLEAALTGRSPLPAEWDGLALTVVVVRGGRPPVLLGALRAVARVRDLPAVSGIVGDTVIMLLAGVDSDWPLLARHELRRHDAGARGAYCSGDADAVPLPELHLLARSAAAVSRDPLMSARALASRVAVEHAEQALIAAPVAADPMSRLVEHDRGTDLVLSLLTWLEAHGDVAAAAESLNIHVNTLRYRLRRAKGLLHGDLSDPEVRLHVHLRLRLAARAAAGDRCA